MPSDDPSDDPSARTWTATQIAEELLALLRTRSSAPVALDSTFDGLGLDSLAMAEFVFEIEATFGINTDDRLLDVRTVQQVVDYVLHALERRRPPS